MERGFARCAGQDVVQGMPQIDWAEGEAKAYRSANGISERHDHASLARRARMEEDC